MLLHVVIVSQLCQTDQIIHFYVGILFHFLYISIKLKEKETKSERQHSTVVNGMDSATKLPGFKSQLKHCCVTLGKLFNSVLHSFLIYKVKINNNTYLISVVLKINELAHIKYSEHYHQTVNAIKNLLLLGLMVKMEE